MTVFVIDSSIAIAAVLPDETTTTATAVLRRAAIEPCSAPFLWRYEVANALEIARRRDRISNERYTAIIAVLFKLRIEMDLTDTDMIRTRIVPLAQKRRLTIYDAAYLELALRLRTPLATLDRALATAARAEGVEIL